MFQMEATPPEVWSYNVHSFSLDLLTELVSIMVHSPGILESGVWSTGVCTHVHQVPWYRGTL